MISTLFSLYLIFSGTISVSATQQSYFASLGTLDWVITAIGFVLNAAAALSLFMLKRTAVFLFGTVLVWTVANTLFSMIRTNWTQAIGGAGLIGVLFGSVLVVAIFLYVQNLAKKGILA